MSSEWLCHLSLLLSSWVPIRETEFPVPRLVRSFEFLHLAFVSFPSPPPCPSPPPPPATEAEAGCAARSACLSTLPFRCRLRVFHSCVPVACSSAGNQKDPGPNLIRADHSPAQNPPVAPTLLSTLALLVLEHATLASTPGPLHLLSILPRFLVWAFHLVSAQMSPPWRSLS